jgi:hypothetical protein
MNQDNGFIGDVKYSLLEPKTFLGGNPGWELLSGQPLDINSDLGKLLQIPRLPDGRGMFIRNMSFDRTDEFKDPDKRNLVDPQHNMVGSHSHAYHYPSYHGSDRLNGGGNYPRVMLEEGGDRNVINNLSTGTETRPNNIALYLYVKVR